MNAARRLVPRLAERHGLPWGPIVDPPWPGVVNDVCVVGPPHDRHVIRARDGVSALAEFEREAWCADAARRAGILTPATVLWGVEGRVSYSVQEWMPGVSGEARRSDDLWRFLGECARAIAGIDLTRAPDGLFLRFGRDLADAWSAHLAYNLTQLTPADPLIRLGVYDETDRPALRAMVDTISDERVAFGLAHGDLALRNLIISPDGEPVLIDWGSAATGPVPSTDLIGLLRNRDEQQNPTDREIDAFIVGFAADPSAVRVALRDLRVLHSLDIVRWAPDAAPERVASTAADARAVVADRLAGDEPSSLS